MGTNFFGKRLWAMMFLMSTIIYLCFSIAIVIRGFDLLGLYMMLSTFCFLLYCNSNLNREVLIETMMRISIWDILTNPKKRTLIEKMMKKDEKGKKTFEEYMKTAKRDIQKDGDEIENK